MKQGTTFLKLAMATSTPFQNPKPYGNCIRTIYGLQLREKLELRFESRSGYGRLSVFLCCIVKKEEMRIQEIHYLRIESEEVKGLRGTSRYNYSKQSGSPFNINVFHAFSGVLQFCHSQKSRIM